MKANPVERCVEILRRRGASEVFLFGSRAKGLATEDSDVDLAVRGLPDSDYFPTLGELMCAVDGRVDLVMLDDDTPFASHIRTKVDRGWAIRVG